MSLDHSTFRDAISKGFTFFEREQFLKKIAMKQKYILYSRHHVELSLLCSPKILFSSSSTLFCAFVYTARAPFRESYFWWKCGRSIWRKIELIFLQVWGQILQYKNFCPFYFALPRSHASLISNKSSHLWLKSGINFFFLLW